MHSWDHDVLHATAARLRRIFSANELLEDGRMSYITLPERKTPEMYLSKPWGLRDQGDDERTVSEGGVGNPETWKRKRKREEREEKEKIAIEAWRQESGCIDPDGFLEEIPEK